jgi:hypothetical protein
MRKCAIKGCKWRYYAEGLCLFHLFCQKKFDREKRHSEKKHISTLRVCIRRLSEYADWRDSCLKRDNYRCQDCSRESNLEVHHCPKPFVILFYEFLRQHPRLSLVENREELVKLAKIWTPFWDVDNGKTLCVDCHKKYHGETCRRVLAFKNSMKESS